MEELFFSGLIGSVQIDSIIPYILRMETAEYNLQMTGQLLSPAQGQATEYSIHSVNGLPAQGTVLQDFNASVINGPAAQVLQAQTITPGSSAWHTHDLDLSYFGQEWCSFLKSADILFSPAGDVSMINS